MWQKKETHAAVSENYSTVNYFLSWTEYVYPSSIPLFFFFFFLSFSSKRITSVCSRRAAQHATRWKNFAEPRGIHITVVSADRTLQHRSVKSSPNENCRCIYRKYTRRQLKRATNVSIKPRSAVSTNRDEINAQVVMILLKQDRERQDEFEKEKNSFSLNDSIWPNHSIRLLQFQQFSQLHFHDIRKQNSILYSAGTNEIRTQKTLLRFEIKILVSGVQKVQFCEALVAHRPLFRPLKKKSSR